MKPRFASLFATNFMGVFNDNFLKTAASLLVVGWVGATEASLYVSVAAGMLVLPYIFLSPLAGNWASTYRKRHIVTLCKIAEFPIVALAIVGMALGSVWMLMLSIFFMGCQSALYSPAKYGLIREVGSVENLSRGIGGFEAVSFLAMLCGTLVASFLGDEQGWTANAAVLVAGACAGLWLSLAIKPKVQYITEKQFTSNPIIYIRDSYRHFRGYRGVNSAVVALSLFWWMAALVQMGLLVYCRKVLLVSAFQTGIVLSAAAVGIAVGCAVSGVVQRRHFRFSGVLTSVLVVSAIYFVLYFVELSVVPFAVAIFVVAVVSGFFKVPLDTYLQSRVKGEDVGEVLAYFNQFSFVFILLASGCYALVSLFEPRALFLMIGVVFLLTIPILLVGIGELFKYFGHIVLKLRYKIRVVGLDVLSPDNNYLILPNHQAVVDPVILFSELYRTDISALVDEAYFKIPLVEGVLEGFDCIPVPDLAKSRRGIEAVRQLDSVALDALGRGKNIILYPAGQITHDGVERLGAKKLAHTLCANLPQDTRVVGVRIAGLWGSAWSRYGRNSTPELLPTLLRVIFTLRWVAPRRRVDIEFVDITDRAKLWAKLDKMEFNRQMEEFYSAK